MTCDEFRASAFDGNDSAEFLEHLRECVACMNEAADRDGDYLFKALGGDGLVPPGGVDAFVGDVMRQIHANETARQIAHARKVSPRYYLAFAAAAALTVASFSLVQRSRPEVVVSPMAAVAESGIAGRHADISRPVVEEYENSAATIVEIPTEQNSSDEIKVVMIFDESLPADL